MAEKIDLVELLKLGEKHPAWPAFADLARRLNVEPAEAIRLMQNWLDERIEQLLAAPRAQEPMRKGGAALLKKIGIG